jgi:hypothetical protein
MDRMGGGQFEGYPGNAFIVQNCTWHGGWLSLTPSAAISLVVRDSSFDGTCLSISNYARSGYANYDYNAFSDASEEFPLSGNHNVVVSGGFNWQSSSFGNYYLPGGSPLIAAGDVTANLVGLYYFTTQTSQAPEGDALVDIGYHYVAADGYGNPLADGTGQPYYLDAGNGNIVEESGELSGAVPPIQFTIAVPNQYVNNATVPLQLTIQSGVPYYCTVMLDSTDFSAASWTPYTSSTIAANLGTAQGWHTVWVGLCGQPSGPAGGGLQSWSAIRLNLDLTAPVLVITSPLASTVSVPVVQLQGYSQVALQSISYDLANDAGVVTNQQVLVLDQVYDTGACQFTTNYFQAFDVSLAPGLNAFTFHATDLAGNTTAASYNLTLDYSGKPAPTVQVYWPLNGTAVSGSSFACNGWVSDPTATVTVQIVDSNGNTNVVNAAVGRDGDFWAQNLPLSPGLNYLTITTTDVANNIVTTSLTVAQGSLGLNIDSVSPGQTTVQGEINSSACANYTIWVNGVKATCTGSASWTADIAPIGAAGGVVEAMAIPNTDNGGQGSGGLDNSGNPYDAQAEGVQGPPVAAQPGCYISMYYSTNYSHINTYSLDEHDSLVWTNGQGGNEKTSYYGDWLPYYPIISTSAWPPSAWPQPWPNGLQTNTLLYGSGSSYVTAIGPPPLIIEHCQIAQTNTFAIDTRAADCKINLATGGNKDSTQANLWVISVTASCPPSPWATFFDDTEQGQGPNAPVPRQNITILGYTPDANNNVYLVLPDNTNTEITPVVKGPDYYTLNIAPVEYTFISQCQATIPTNQRRTNIGVGELLSLYFSPSLPINAVWTASAGSLASTASTANVFTAPSNATMTATITETFPNGQALRNNFTVVQPTGVAHADLISTNSYPTGESGAGMYRWVYIGPTNVSFYRVQCMEAIANATSISGYYDTNYSVGELMDTNANVWFQLNMDNSWPHWPNNDDDYDHAEWANDPSPWTGGGGFSWAYYPKWKVGTNGQTNLFQNAWTQQMTLGSDGSLKIQKFGHTVQRNTNNIYTTQN